jgi:protein transport protein SEC23
VAGLLGPACRMDKKGPAVAEAEVGQGGTTQWKMCGLDADTSVAVFFEIVGSGQGQGQEGQVRKGG